MEETAEERWWGGEGESKEWGSRSGQSIELKWNYGSRGRKHCAHRGPELLLAGGDTEGVRAPVKSTHIKLPLLSQGERGLALKNRMAVCSGFTFVQVGQIRVLLV